MLFRDRAAAGQQLAERLASRRLTDPVVLALPRGGVPVGYQVAVQLDAPLDIILVRKIGVPWQRELAVGAVADGDHPEVVTNRSIQAELGLSDEYVKEESEQQLREIERRRHLYLGDRAPLPVRGRTAILVDDGIATGATVRAALQATRRRQPHTIILAVPVAPAETIDALRHEADEILCLHMPADFGGVGQFYADFEQVDDTTVAALLRQNAAAMSRGARGKHKGENG
ncbi:phosphoribosyltransferase [Dongia sedimenti]|uniref:Phosphoribosyltransferase n=1 Tax=Dongia sedimenti TaxID=3064282 RepID=A0ABU0YGV5_9PROT|nr:phosphoribosyltransferase [Rhodospirillaceae bacterium R-7]